MATAQKSLELFEYSVLDDDCLSRAFCRSLENFVVVVFLRSQSMNRFFIFYFYAKEKRREIKYQISLERALPFCQTLNDVDKNVHNFFFF